MAVNVKQHILRAERARQKGNFESARKYAKPVYLQDPKNYDALLILALAELGLSNFPGALEYALKLREYFPKHPNGAMVGSVALMNMRQNKAAVQMLEEQLERDPKNKALLFNLHSAYGGLDDQTTALRVALDTVGFYPTDSDAYNNLGASLSNVGRRKDAAIAFQTAVDLNPKNLTARLNLIHTKFKQEENDEELIRELEATKAELKVVDITQKRILIGAVHNSAFAHFRLGQLKQGWEALESGFSSEIDSNRGRKPNRGFKAKRWKGEPLNGKTLLVWREQGLGDELMFGSMLHELIQLDGKVILECEPRLVELLQNSFPSFTVRSELYRAVYPFDCPTEDFDVQIPLGSLGGLFRNSIEQFPSNSAYVVPLESEVNDIANRLVDIKKEKKKIVGLCWRSGVVSPTRGSNYTLLEDWEKLLTNPNIAVVNLQYGKCEDEILEIEKRFGVKLIRWPDISLQNDQSKLAAIIKNLDYVFSIGSAVAQMAGAVGTPTGMVAIKAGWPSFGTSFYPFFSSVTRFFAGDDKDIRGAVKACVENFERTIR